MQTAQHTLSRRKGSRGAAEARRDLIPAAVLCALAYALAASLGVLETLVASDGGWRINEIGAVLAVLTASVGAFSLVRWRALKAAAIRHQASRN